VSTESLIDDLPKKDAQKILRQELGEAEQDSEAEQNDEAVSDEWQDATQAEAVSEWKEGLEWE
jgi:hypothetical protein